MRDEALHRNAACDRARERVSLGLDGELTDFEQVLLRAHVRRCRECGTFAEHATLLTERIRAEPLVPIGLPVAIQGVRRRRRRTARSGVAVAAAALACASAAAAVVALNVSGRSNSFAEAVFPGDASAPSDLAKLRILRSEQLRDATGARHRTRGLLI